MERVVSAVCGCTAGVCAASPDGKVRGRISVISDVRCRQAGETIPDVLREMGADWAVPGGVTATALLDAAAGHMHDRAATYDRPEGERSMGRTVAAFNEITGRDLTESEGWLLMVTLKLVRGQQRTEPHRDSAEDAVAYAALYGESRLGGR
jgi:hypothetical protein